MSHSKYTKRGRSLYVENWNPDSKRFINTCAVCGAQGYSPTIDEEGFVFDKANNVNDRIHLVIRDELTKIYAPLPLDELGRCEQCAKIIDKK